MRVFVIATGLRVGGGLSVGLNMIESLGRVAPQHAYAFLVPTGLGYEALCGSFPDSRTIAYQHRGYLRRLQFEHTEIPRLVAEFAPNAILALSGQGLTRPPCVQAIFPQNPHLLYPSKHFGREAWWARLKIVYLKRHMARQLRHTQLVLVQTETVARRLRQCFGYTGRVVVCRSSISKFMRDSTSGNPRPAVLGALRGRFVLLYLTRYYAHKNIEGAIRLFDDHRDQLADVTMLLTLAPEQHPSAPAALRLIEQLGLSDHVRNIGPIPHAEVGGYYEHCDALFAPTLLETFGLPYLEAMNYGLPILTSDLDFAREVCGDAAHYFDPWRSESMLDAICRLRDDASLPGRLREAGRRRLETAYPTWDEIVSNVMTELTALV